MKNIFYIVYADHLEYKSHTLYLADLGCTVFSANPNDAVMFRDELLALDYGTTIEAVLGNKYVGRTKKVEIP